MRLSQRLVALSAVVVLLVPVGSGGAADKPQGFKLKDFQSNGVKIVYTIEGEGEPVILIHGWLSNAGINWGLPGTASLLGKDHQVIAIDVRGHGLSDKPTKDEDYGLELVEDVVRLMDHLKIEKAHIVGYSMGGIITAKFLVKHPDRALSGTLAGAGWLKEGSLEQKVFAEGGKDGKPVGLCFKSLAKLALTEEEVKAIKVPVRMIFGDKDFLKAAYGDPVKKVREDWKLVEIKDADHLTCIIKPQFKEEIQAWIEEQKAKK
jgi:pimeloyl-ACP methyl ester carboxylesterase